LILVRICLALGSIATAKRASKHTEAKREMRMNVIIYLIFAGSLPPPLSVLQVNQYSRPRSEYSPFIFCLSPSSFSYLPPCRVRYPASALSLSLSPLPLSFSLLFLFPPLSSTLKVHRHYFRRNRRTSIRRRDVSPGTTKNSNDC